MKTKICFIFFLLLLPFALSSQNLIDGLIGSGTENDPVQISSAQDLQSLSDFVMQDTVFASVGGKYYLQSNTFRKYFKLMNDIDMAGVENFTPIGGWKDNNSNEVYIGLLDTIIDVNIISNGRDFRKSDTLFQNQRIFRGYFDGNNKKIHNLIIDKGNKDYIGLFGITESSNITNLGLENSLVKGVKYVGALIGYAYKSTRIDSCYSEGDVYGIGENSFEVGGLIGALNSSYVKNSYSYSHVKSEGREVGGLIGGILCITLWNTKAICYPLVSDIARSYTSGLVMGIEYVGGLCGKKNYDGYYYNSNIYDNDDYRGSCYSTSEVIGGNNIDAYSKDSKYIGGLVGEGAIHTSYFGGDVRGGKYVGGLVGSGYAQTSYSNSSVVGDDYVGGIVGKVNGVDNYYSYYGGCFNNSSRGSVSGRTNVGGLIGGLSYDKRNIRIYNSFSKCNIYSYGDNSNVGGLLGSDDDNTYGLAMDKCYFRGSITSVGKNSNVGGLVGLVGNGKISNTYSAPISIETDNSSKKGTVVGTCLKGEFINNYYLKGVTDNPIGFETNVNIKQISGKTKEEFVSPSMIDSLDRTNFVHDYLINEINDGYPCLESIDRYVIAQTIDNYEVGLLTGKVKHDYLGYDDYFQNKYIEEGFEIKEEGTFIKRRIRLKASGSGNIRTRIENLKPNKRYRYRAFVVMKIYNLAVNQDKSYTPFVAYGEYKEFDTYVFSEPKVSTDRADYYIKDSAAWIQMSVKKGLDEVIEKGVEYKIVEQEQWDKKIILEDKEYMIIKLDSLSYDTVYECRAYAKTDKGIYYGDIMTFRTITLSGLDDAVRDKTNITIYPNPARSEVMIKTEGLTESKKIIITDIQGREVLNDKISNEEKRLDISSLSKGIYLIRVGDKVQKLIIH